MHHVASVSSPCTDGVAGPLQTQANNFISNLSGSYVCTSFYFPPTLKHSVFSAEIVNRNAFKTTDWIIDTGATDDMVHSTIMLNSHDNLPNGEIALVPHIGTVKISETLILRDVLCVTSFSFNLISVSKLTKSVLCYLKFFGSLCFIQALAPWCTLGLGREHNGLYLLEDSIPSFNSFSVLASVTNVQPHVWHSRLGHISNAKLAFMKNNIPLLCGNKDFHCEIFPLAKQIKIVFFF